MLTEAAWPALTRLSAAMAFGTAALGAALRHVGPRLDACALGAGAFAACPALEVLDLSFVRFGEEGARLLASRPWVCLELNFFAGSIGAAGLAALERGDWPALRRIDARGSGCPRLALAAARRWTPALEDAAETNFGAAHKL